jgi:hypothetical protein
MRLWVTDSLLALCFLPGVAMLALWVRSYYITQGYERITVHISGGRFIRHIYSVRSTAGTIYAGRSDEVRRAQPEDRQQTDGEYYRLTAARAAGIIPFWKRRFGFDTTQLPNGMRLYIFALPHPILAALLALPGALWLRSHIRKRWCRLAGHCSRCGYDLRATPDRCPECGTAAAVNASKSS